MPRGCVREAAFGSFGTSRMWDGSACVFGVNAHTYDIPRTPETKMTEAALPWEGVQSVFRCAFLGALIEGGPFKLEELPDTAQSALVWLRQVFETGYSEPPFPQALDYLQSPVLDSLKRNLQTPGGFAADLAEQGWLVSLQWSQSRKNVHDEWLGESAAQGGHLDVLKWLVSQGHALNQRTLEAAALGGHVTVIKWLLAQGCPLNGMVWVNAIFRGHKEVLHWLVAQGYACPVYACDDAAKWGRLDLLQWLIRQGSRVSEHTWRNAAKGGHLAVLQWLHAQGYAMPFRLCDIARKAGHLNVYEWLLDH